ncbi:MAG: hypothetical protein WAU20_02765, partial [Dokdonella sp.]
ATTWLYRILETAPAHFTIAYTITGLLVGVTGAIPSLMVHAFPAAIRFSGISFAYNVAYAILGGLTPVVGSRWIGAGQIHAPAFYVATACLGGIVAALWARQRRTVASSSETTHSVNN